MPLSDWLLHVGNAWAPAWCLALVLPAVHRLFTKKPVKTPALRAQTAIQLIALSLTQACVWMLWGRDGLLAGYALLVTTAASVQWLLARGWRG